MIQANELRFNNLLDYHGQSVRVMVVDRWSAEFGYFEDSVGFGRRFDEEDFPQPIPLTEEWLLKFGFDVTKSITNNITATKEIFVNRTLSVKSGFLDEKDVEDFWIGISNAHISNAKYVHQLQNLYFALTGTELTLNTENGNQ